MVVVVELTVCIWDSHSTHDSKGRDTFVDITSRIGKRVIKPEHARYIRDVGSSVVIVR